MNWDGVYTEIEFFSVEIATILALISAISHAGFGALLKGRLNPWLARASIDFFYFIISLSIAIFLVPLPERSGWYLLFGAFLIHTIYKVLNLMAYSRAQYTVVYPVVLGVSPIATIILAFYVFKEIFVLIQWIGVILLSTSILCLSVSDIFNKNSGRTN